MAIFEVIFNITYLAVIWFVVIKMWKKRSLSKVNTYYFLAFLLLGFGDTFHVGFRSIAHILGDINYSMGDIKLIGIGAFATGITVSITYWFFMKAVHTEYPSQKLFNWMSVTVLIRLLILFFPQNQWFSSATYGWTLLRNLPLVVIGILLLVAMFKTKDPFYKKFAWYIILSYLFYLPVILFVKFVPMVGMLMMPKTVMYLFMLFHVNKKYFSSTSD